MALNEPQRRIGQRQDFLILLPVALLLLVLLSTFALLSYRNTVALLIEGRQAEAVQLARKLARTIESSPPATPMPSAEELKQRFPGPRSIAILDERDRLIVATDIRAVSWAGEHDAGEDLVTGFTRYSKSGESFTIQVDLAAPLLRSRERGLRVLTPVLLTMNAAITLLVLLFLRHFWAPFEGLLERARSAGQEPPKSGDDVDFLVATLERALEALNKPPPDRATDELEVLENTLTHSLQSGVLLCSPDGVVLALNEIGSALLEIEDSPVGQPIATALVEHPELAQLLARAVETGREVRRHECTLSTASGERTLGLTAHPLRRGERQVAGFLVLFADLTDSRRELEERRLAESLSQLGELTAGVAHELRNSLATLRGYLTLIDRDPEGDSTDDYLAEIRHESDHLERVLDDFLAFARPGSVRPQPVDLLRLIHRSAADPALAGAPIAVGRWTPDPAEPGGRPAVEGDPQLLERALRNLLYNAVESHRRAGKDVHTVRVSVRGRDGGVEVRIEDRGTGLSDEAQEKLFDPFFSQRVGGVGMGLALTRRIALLHGGRVALENRDGGGVRASMWLPPGKIATIGNHPELPADPVGSN